MSSGFWSSSPAGCNIVKILCISRLVGHRSIYFPGWLFIFTLLIMSVYFTSVQNLVLQYLKQKKKKKKKVEKKRKEKERKEKKRKGKRKGKMCIAYRDMDKYSIYLFVSNSVENFEVNQYKCGNLLTHHLQSLP